MSLMFSFAEKPPLRKKDCRPTHGWRRGPTLAHAHTQRKDRGKKVRPSWIHHTSQVRLHQAFPSFSASCFGSLAANCGEGGGVGGGRSIYFSWLPLVVLRETSGSGHLQLEFVFDCWVYAEVWPWCWWAVRAAAFHPEVGLPHSRGLLLHRRLLTAGDQRWVWVGRSEALQQLLPVDVRSRWGQGENHIVILCVVFECGPTRRPVVCVCVWTCCVCFMVITTPLLILVCICGSLTVLFQVLKSLPVEVYFIFLLFVSWLWPEGWMTSCYWLSRLL